MKRDFSSLADELDNLEDGGPTVAEDLRSQQTSKLMEQVLIALSRPQAAPTVHVAAPTMPSIAFPELNIPAPVVTVQQPQRVLDWTFTFERNGDGTIKSIRAKAT